MSRSDRFSRGRRAAWLLSAAALGLGGAVGIAADGSSTPEPAAHPPVRFEEGRFWSETAGERRPIADVSAYCMECHGARGEGAAAAPEVPATPHLGGPQRNHPVDVVYPAADPGYLPVADLDPRLPLLAGRISCLTCHRHAASDHAVALPTEQGRLCQACHRL